MGLFKKLSGLFAPSPARQDPAEWITVRCRRCGERIQTRIDLNNDLSAHYGQRSGETTYYCRKMLMGSQQCFQKIEIELTFDNQRRLTETQIVGGEFVKEGS